LDNSILKLGYVMISRFHGPTSSINILKDSLEIS
jgi:hypothetical protein